MKRKLLMLSLMLTLAICSIVGLTACEQQHEHSYSSKTTPPTCTELGYTTYTCSCGDSYIDDYVSSLGHKYTNYQYNNDAKCGVNGTETASCNRGCGTTHTRTAKNTALSHDYGTPKYSWDGQQCTAIRVCLNNEKHKKTETVTAVYVKDTDAKCGANEKGHYKATFKNSAFTVQETAKNSVEKENTALTHEFTNYIYNNDAKCGVNGTEMASCNHGCGTTDTRTVENTALTHEFTNYTYNNDAKCEVNGTEKASCNHGCGATDTRTAKNTALTHEFTNYTYNNDAKCEVNGTEKASCNHGCGATDTRTKEGSALTHEFTNYTYNNDAKCEVNGTETASCNHGCGTTDTRTKEGTALTHSYGAPTYTWNNDYTKCTAKRVCQKDITHIETETINAVYYVVNDATIYSNGTVKYIATFTNKHFNQQSIEIKIAKLESVSIKYYLNSNSVVYEDIAVKGKPYSISYECNLLGYEKNIWCYANGQVYEEKILNDDIELYPVVKEEMSNFDFTSNSNECTIYGVKDKTITEIVVPEYVTDVSWGAFAGCGQLKTLTLPFMDKKLVNYFYNYYAEINNRTEVIFGEENFVPQKTTVKSYYDYKGTLCYIGIPDSSAGWDYIGGNVVVNGVEYRPLPSVAVRDWKEVVTYVPGNYYTYSVPTSATVTFEPIITENAPVKNLIITNQIKELNRDYVYGQGVNLSYNEYDNAYYLSDGETDFAYLVKEKNANIKSCIFHPDTKQVASYAFKNCTALTSVMLSNNLRSFDRNAFYGCSLSLYNKYDNAFYLGNESNPYAVLVGTNYEISSCVIHEDTKIISNSAFIWCQNLQEIIIPNGVSYLGYNAFYGCSNLKTVTIGDNVQRIGDYAFDYCASLTNVIIGDSVTSIGDYAFRECTSLTNVTMGNSVTSIGNYAFYNCDSLTSVTIDNSVISIGEHAFANCNSLTNVTIGDSVTSIGNSAFYGCTLLTNVIIGNSVTSIGERAFAYCTSLTSIEIPNSVKSIGEKAFDYCPIEKATIPTSAISSIPKSKLKTVVIIDGESIGKSAFYGCTSLTNVIIGNSVTSIGERAFAHCDSLTSVKIPNSVTSIGEYAFAYCGSLTSVELPSSVTSLSDDAFAYCDSLTSVTIPSSVTSIGSWAFYGNDQLSIIEYKGSVDEWNSISKGLHWHNRYSIIVQCTDGEITIYK